MTRTVASAARQVAGQTLAPTLPGMIGAVPSPSRSGQPQGNSGAWLLPLVATAIDRCMSRKEAALILGISESTLSRQLAGEDGKYLNFQKFGALGDPVALALIDELRAYFKLDDPDAQLQRAMRLVTDGLALLAALVKR